MTKCLCGPARQGQFAPPPQPLPTPSVDTLAPKYPQQPPKIGLKEE
jgi:hypothetical protein